MRYFLTALYTIGLFAVISRGQGVYQGFSSRATKAPAVLSKPHRKSGTKSDAPAQPAESRLLTLLVSSDMDGTLFLENKEGRAIKSGEPLSIPVFRENCTLYFAGQNGFTYKEVLSFSPEKKGTTIDKTLLLAKHYRIYLLKQQEQSEEERILNGVIQNMIPVEPEGQELSAFEISRFEVTIAQYAYFARDQKNDRDNSPVDSSLVLVLPSGERRFRQGINWQNNELGELRSKDEYDHPVIHVNWYEAEDFCKWLTQRDPVYAYRLPTAAEWEYVAGCGEYRYQFPWGNDLSIDSMPANTADTALKERIPKRKDTVSEIDDSFAFTSPVGYYYAPCFGIYDLGGNVAEWVSDDVQRIVGTKNVWEKQIKGGSYFTLPGSSEVKSSFSRNPELRHCAIGFRVVRQPK